MSADLKRLGFVQSTTSVAYTEAEKLYKTLRSYAPQFVATQLEKVEGQVAATAAPYVTMAQDRCDQLLKLADDRVDYFVHKADDVKTSITHGKNGVASGLKTTSDNYLHLVSKAADYVVETMKARGIQAVKAVEVARDTLQVAVAKAREASSDPDAAVRVAADAWAQFAALPPVAVLLNTAAPATKVGVQVFSTLHDRLVSNSMYKLAVDSTAGTIQYATKTSGYKLGAIYVYPLLQPYADPAIAKVTQSKVVNNVVEYWKPAAPASITAH